MNLLAWRSRRVTSTNMRLIDYRTTAWGHNLTIKQGEDGLLRGHIWHYGGATVGDRLIWRTISGTSTGEILECRWLGDPDDMYHVTVKVIERSAD